MKKLLLIASLLIFCLPIHAELRLKYPTGDHMVLQQQTDAAVFGFAKPGATISVTPSWDGKTYKATADGKGRWTVYVRTPEASYKTYTVAVAGDGGKITIEDVIVGEVWLASGQSNMEMPVKGFDSCPVEGYNEIITQAPAWDKIRMLYVRADQSDDPLEEVRLTDGWRGADPDNIPDMSAVGYFFARKLNQVLDIPVGVVAFPRGGARVESWLPKETVAGYGEDLSPEAVDKRAFYTRAFQMYNAMQIPLQGYTARGFIWYQGCSNVGHHDEFVARMQDLVRQWRSDWNDTAGAMPFYMVEIAPYLYSGDNSGDGGAWLRQAQHEAAKVIPNCGIITTNDLVAPYEAGNIHPCRKEPVGNRLAYMALNRDYGYTRIACDSPEAVSISKVEGRFGEVTRVELVNCAHGISRTREIEGMEVCGADGVWHKIDQVQFSRGGIVPVCREVQDIREVRYGWGDFKPGNILSNEGLPLVPFWLKLEQ